MSVDPELDSFKRLDLREYAASQGYVFDRRESWRGSAVMRNGTGDKVVIKLGPDGYYVYFSVRDDRDNGSIIDFVKHLSQANLGGIRKVLRIWAGQKYIFLEISVAGYTGDDRSVSFCQGFVWDHFAKKFEPQSGCIEGEDTKG